MEGTKKKQEEVTQGFIDLIFSWSIADIMNQDLYKNKVNRIPKTFSSARQYFSSFMYPLIEETHADLRSNITTLFRAPSREIFGVRRIKDDNNPEKLTYRINLKPRSSSIKVKPGGSYEPEFGDLIVLTEVKAKCINDLNRPNRSYIMAVVQGEYSSVIQSSKPIEKRKSKLFATYLTNLITNSRIWQALNPDIDGGNMKIINSVLTTKLSVEEHCSRCSSLNFSKSSEGISSFGLGDAQKDAVLNCIAATECCHKTNVKLIWGPPGTGKTKTISALVFSLLKMKCGTLICAPTNIAVVGVANRLLSLLGGTLTFAPTYGFGDVVLFGNKERMNINEHDDVYDIFLANRVSVLAHCFASQTGWRDSLLSMIGLLEDPEDQYLRYLSRAKEENSEESDNDDEDEENTEESNNDDDDNTDDDDDTDDEVEERNVNESRKGKFETKSWKDLISHELEDAEKRNLKCAREGGQSKSVKIPLPFEEFFTVTFRRYAERIEGCISDLYTHMPTSYLNLEGVHKMNRFLELLQRLQSLVSNVCRGRIREALKRNEEIERTKVECVKVYESFRGSFNIPYLSEYNEIKKFCLKNACLIFCTASSSAKLHTEEITTIEMVIIDEAAQLKECESSIPLQLSGVRNVVLVGDEKQLPAMVRSKICEKVNFGRSLFERLATLGHSKHLLNVQYRMHPSISLFPNCEFYGNQIKNGQNVMERTHERRFLEGKIFGSYSFINVDSGKEGFDDRHSKKNMVEVFVVAEIVSKLYQESAHSKQKVRVGCISPYKAQVHAIQERLGKRYSMDLKDKFSVNVRSVDGFQGGEEDIIIISTVRCNGHGSVGFLSNCQRTNVALTRARHCLWILGNGATLLNSGCVWEKLVRNANGRGCFYNASDDKSLALAISNAKMISLFNMDSILFKASKWKVCFSDEFHDSMIRLQPSGGIHDDIVSVLVKLSNGWRQMYKDDTFGHTEGRSSQLLEIYDVKEQLKLIWSVQILEKNSLDIQVIKIWDILPRIEVIPKIAKKLDILFKNYKDDYMSRCICKRIEGNLTLPMKWPVDSNARSDYSSKDPSHELSTKLTAISLN